MLQHVAVTSKVRAILFQVDFKSLCSLQCIAVHCSVLQCVAVPHSALQCIAVCAVTRKVRAILFQVDLKNCVTVCYSVLQDFAACCSVYSDKQKSMQYPSNLTSKFL